MKRKICLLLALVMLLSTFVLLTSCDTSNDDPAATTVTTLPDDSGGNGDPNLYEDVPTGSYEGYVFSFLNNGTGMSALVPEETTETVDAAMFARNSFVKEKLGIDIAETQKGYAAVRSTMASLTSSNDFEYDATFNEVYLQTPLAQMGTYIATEDYTDSINFDKPWWFKDTMDSFAIDGKGYELLGDLHLSCYEMIWGMTFNQQEFIDNKIAFPYDLVRSGNWTFAELEKILKVTANKPGEEHYGVVSHKDFISAIIAACDFTLVNQDDDEILLPFENEDRFVDVYSMLTTLFFQSNGNNKTNWIIADYSSMAYTSGAFKSDETFQEKFINKKATFMSGVIYDIRQVRRSEFEYGIIPLPKFDTDQDLYVSNVYRAASACGIPATSPDLDRTCIILENLSAYSYKLLKHEYYEVVVQGRTVRDNDSIEMLEIIFGHTDLGVTRFEIDGVYTLGISEEVRRSMSDNVTEIMNNVDGVMNAVSNEIEKIVEAYK